MDLRIRFRCSNDVTVTHMSIDKNRFSFKGFGYKRMMRAGDSGVLWIFIKGGREKPIFKAKAEVASFTRNYRTGDYHIDLDVSAEQKEIDAFTATVLK